MAFLDDINRLYDRVAEIWDNNNGMDLKVLGGGFNVTLEALQPGLANGTECNVALDGELSNIKIGLNVYKQHYFGRDWQPVY